MEKYRIVRDKWLGFEVQYKPRLWPFWIQCDRHGRGGGINTHRTLEKAEELARLHSKRRSECRVVKVLGEL